MDKLGAESCGKAVACLVAEVLSLNRTTGGAATEQNVRCWRQWKHLQATAVYKYLAVQSRKSGHPLIETRPRFFILQ